MRVQLESDPAQPQSRFALAVALYPAPFCQPLKAESPSHEVISNLEIFLH